MQSWRVTVRLAKFVRSGEVVVMAGAYLVELGTGAYVQRVFDLLRSPDSERGDDLPTPRASQGEIG